MFPKISYFRACVSTFVCWEQQHIHSVPLKKKHQKIQLSPLEAPSCLYWIHIKEQLSNLNSWSELGLKQKCLFSFSTKFREKIKFRNVFIFAKPPNFFSVFAQKIFFLQKQKYVYYTYVPKTSGKTNICTKIFVFSRKTAQIFFHQKLFTKWALRKCEN